MPFPSSPTNGQVYTSGDRTWTYDSAKNAWVGGLNTLTAPVVSGLVDSATAATPNDADLLPVAESSSVLKKITFANLWTYIKAKIDAGHTWAGAHSFSTRPTSSGTGAPASASLITTSDSRRIFHDKLRTLIYPTSITWTGATTTGASHYTNGPVYVLVGANGSSAGAVSVHQVVRARAGVSPPSNFVSYGSIDFSNPIAANFAFSTFNHNLASGLNWAFLVGSTETLAAGLANMVKTGTVATIGWVGLQCVNGNVTIIAVNGTSAVGQSGTIDTCISGVNQKAYRIEISGGTANVYSDSGALLGSLSTNVPSTGKGLNSPVIMIEALETTNQIGINVHLASLDW